MKNKLFALFTMLALFVSVHKANAGTWGPWCPIGNSVSVSVSQVTGGTWTWKFRNDGATAITYMDFYYYDTTGQNTDILPGSLQPGQVIGGWAAFTSSSNPSFQIKTINRAGY